MFVRNKNMPNSVGNRLCHIESLDITYGVVEEGLLLEALAEHVQGHVLVPPVPVGSGSYPTE